MHPIVRSKRHASSHVKLYECAVMQERAQTIIRGFGVTIGTQIGKRLCACKLAILASFIGFQFV